MSITDPVARVRDTAGNVQEWTADPYPQQPSHHYVCGPHVGDFKDILETRHLLTRKRPGKDPRDVLGCRGVREVEAR